MCPASAIHPPRFDRPNEAWRGVRITKLMTVSSGRVLALSYILLTTFTQTPAVYVLPQGERPNVEGKGCNAV
jgi:hypothetical protein